MKRRDGVRKSRISRPVISLICPVRDEAESISSIIRAVRPLGGATELIFAEGGSRDGTWEEILRHQNFVTSTGVLVRALRVPGAGKAAAVAAGFDAARGKYLFIWDADQSISLAGVRRCLELFLTYGDKTIACGNRLAGLPKPAPFFWINYIGNYFFRYLYSLVLGVQILDISCGTKGMTRTAWEKVKKIRNEEGPLDAWGDIDWLWYGLRAGCTPRFAQVSYGFRRRGTSKLENYVVRWAFAWSMFTIALRIAGRRIRGV